MTSETAGAPHPYDVLTTATMRAGGSWKWSTPGSWRDGDLIGAFVAEMDYPVAPAVAEAVHAAADASRFGYLPDDWVADMAAACASFWSDRFDWALDPARIRPLPDVLTGLRAVVEHFTPPGTPVLVPVPAYMPFLGLPGALGRDLIEVPMARDGDRYVYDLDALDGDAHAAGLDLVDRWATWGRAPYEGGDYAVSVFRSGGAEP